MNLARKQSAFDVGGRGSGLNGHWRRPEPLPFCCGQLCDWVVGRLDCWLVSWLAGYLASQQVAVH